MGENILRCSVCGAAAEGSAPVCPRCGGQWEVALDLQAGRDAYRACIQGGCRTGVWDYRPLLPVSSIRHPVTLQEGNTPLVDASDLARRMGLRHLYLKNETRNPSGTYKDRFATVAVSLEKEAGTPAVALGSAGNAAASISAYCAKANLPCYVFLPPGAVSERAWQVRGYGARLLRLGQTIDDCIAMARAGEDLFGWRSLTTNMLTNPLGSEGYKTIAYELGVQLGFQVPDWIFVPVGGGALLSKIFKGFQEMLDLGLTDKLPRLVGVQAQGCAPLTAAFQKGASVTERWPGVPETIAFAIADVEVYDGAAALHALRVTGGRSDAVSDGDILAAMRAIAEEEAVLAEPASAATVACVAQLQREGAIAPGDRVVCILSGNGMRDLRLMEQGRPEIPWVSAGDTAAVKDWMDSL